MNVRLKYCDLNTFSATIITKLATHTDLASPSNILCLALMKAVN
jgi:hypothetical protein